MSLESSRAGLTCFVEFHGETWLRSVWAVDVNNCILAKEAAIDCRSCLSLSEVRPSIDTVKQVGSKQRLNGYFARAMYLLDRFELHHRSLLEEYWLNDDGIAVMPCNHSRNSLNRINARFADFVLSGKRLTDAMDRMLRKALGEESESYIVWKTNASGFFDKRIEYAVLQELRNEQEHGNARISVVNYDKRTNTMKIALNIDSGLLEKGVLKENVRERVREYRSFQIANGLSPWFSVGRMVGSYYGEISFLTLLFLKIMSIAYAECVLTDEVKTEIDGFNCIYCRVDSGDSEDAYCSDRVYPLPSEADARVMIMDLRKVANELAMMIPEMRKEIDELVTLSSNPSWYQQSAKLGTGSQPLWYRR